MFEKFFKWLENKKYEGSLIMGYGTCKLKTNPGAKNPFVLTEGKIVKGGKNNQPTLSRPKPPEGQTKYKIKLPIVKKSTQPKMKKPLTEGENFCFAPRQINKVPYIICSAIHVNDEKEYVHQPKNIVSGFVVCGRRHHNCYIFLLKVSNNYKNKCTQGFLTSDDIFVTRSEAGRIAFIANQTEKQHNVLMSEDIY